MITTIRPLAFVRGIFVFLFLTKDKKAAFSFYKWPKCLQVEDKNATKKCKWPNCLYDFVAFFTTFFLTRFRVSLFVSLSVCLSQILQLKIRSLPD